MKNYRNALQLPFVSIKPPILGNKSAARFSASCHTHRPGNISPEKGHDEGIDGPDRAGSPPLTVMLHPK
jgi:hypothetical protein